MKALLLSLLSLLTFSSCIADNSPGDTLRNTLQNSMLQSHQAILSGDFQKFIHSIDPLNANSHLLEEQWQAVLANKLTRKLLLRSLPNLKRDSIFLSTLKQGNWAIYYAETSLNDSNYQTLSAFLFHHSADGWRPAGKKYGLSKAKPGSKAALTYPSWSGKDDMLKHLTINPDFSFEHLIPLQPHE